MNFEYTSLGTTQPRPIGYINAGGRGTRLNGVFTPNPETGIAKALLDIGAPSVKLIDHHIANFRSQGIEEVVVAAGDQQEVYQYIQDMYDDDEYVMATKSEHQLGNGGDLVMYARELTIDGSLLIQNVDTILDINLQEFARQFTLQRSIGGVACIALTLNAGVPNEGAFQVDEIGKVLHSREFTDSDGEALLSSDVAYRASSTGAVAMDIAFLRNQRWRPTDGQLSLYRDCLRESWENDSLYAFNNGYGFFRDVGTVATWLVSQEDIELQNQLRYTQEQQLNLD